MRFFCPAHFHGKSTPESTPESTPIPTTIARGFGVTLPTENTLGKSANAGLASRRFTLALFYYA
jgi:hypothetical protein